MPGILAIDPATRLGWAWTLPGAEPQWGNERLGRDGATLGEVGAALSIFLEARLALFHPDIVIFEAPFVPQPKRDGSSSVPMNATTLRRLMGLPTVIETICMQRGVECLEEPTLTFTEFFTGERLFPGKTYEQRRKAKHEAVMAECRSRGWMVSQNDEAMALALLAFAEWKLHPQAARRRPVVPGPLFAEAAA